MITAIQRSPNHEEINPIDEFDRLGVPSFIRNQILLNEEDEDEEEDHLPKGHSS